MNNLTKINSKEALSSFRDIAAIILVRDHNFELADARYEAEIVSNRLGLGTLVDDPKSYLRMSRIGARKILNQKQRRKLIPSFTNAIKQANSISGNNIN